MIFDKTENIALYKGMHSAVDVAIDHILSHDSAAYDSSDPVNLEGGVYYSVADVSLRPREDIRWECHDEYIDLQYIIDGDAETIEYICRGDIEGWEKKTGGDIYFSSDERQGLPLSIAPGAFALFFPNDAHRPAQGRAGEQSRKVVYKIPCLKKEI